MADLTHIPRPVVKTILAHARAMRDIRADQQPNQWTNARYALADDLADTLRQRHNIHAAAWARDFVFCIAT